MSIAIYNTFCGSSNSGDAIIMDAVFGVLCDLFPISHKISYPTHYPLSLNAINKAKKSHISFVGGTNLLSSSISFRSRKNNWAISYLGAMLLNKHSVLLGCGWKEYQGFPSFMSRLFYKKILSDRFLHSVRDSYSAQKMNSVGFENVINTSCPTMWGLSKDHCLSIPRSKCNDVIFTLTDYRPLPKRDAEVIKLIQKSYRNIYFWAQGSKDISYLSSICDSKSMNMFKIIGPDLSSFDAVLKNNTSIDYVGTRLHAGIRAMQMKKRAVIIGIDNRAMEKRKDFNLPVVERGDIKSLEYIISNSFETDIHLPVENINKWKSQFDSISNIFATCRV
jgi:polysaccharide pyruvyl transferase WcaK-like protein